jgi:hypothetical protein
MTKRIKLKGGDEYDAFSRASRTLLQWRSGEVKKIKRKHNKRVRQENKSAMREVNNDD